nr:MAG TPA: hypothetical protein [Caudoviricetes sp.]
MAKTQRRNLDVKSDTKTKVPPIKNLDITKNDSKDAEITDMRLEMVLTQMLNGARTSIIKQTIKQQWGIGERQAQKYIAAAKKRIKASYDEQIPDFIQTQLEKINHVYYEAMKNGERANALAALKQAAQLVGAEAPTKSETTVKISGAIKGMSDDELTRIIQGVSGTESSSSDGADRAQGS